MHGSGCHGDFAGCGTQLQGCVQFHSLVRINLDALRDKRPETFHFDRHVVGRGRKRLHVVIARSIGRGRLSLLGPGVSGSDRGAGNDRSGGIGDGAQDRARGSGLAVYPGYTGTRQVSEKHEGRQRQQTLPFHLGLLWRLVASLPV